MSRKRYASGEAVEAGETCQPEEQYGDTLEEEVVIPEDSTTVLTSLTPFDVRSADLQIERTITELRKHEELFKQRYEELLNSLKVWINDGLNFEYETAQEA